MQNYGPTWLNESYYQNIPHNEVNWAQLAQQWIAMRGPDVHTPVQSTDFQQYTQQEAAFPPQFVNQGQPMPFAGHQPVFSGGNFGMPEASMTVYPLARPVMQPGPFPPRMGGGLLPTPPLRQRFRPPFGLQPRNVQRLGGPSLENFRPFMGTEVPTRPLFPAAGPAVRHPNYHDKMERGESFASLYNEEEDPNYMPEAVESSENILPRDTEPEESYRKEINNPYQASWQQPPVIGGPPQSLLKMPLIPLTQAPHVYRGFYDDESFDDSSSNFLDAQQREKLPAWIREGLEKVQREKMKQMQKEEEEKLVKEQEKSKKKSGKSKFESDSEEEEDADEQESKSKQPSPERLNQKVESGNSDEETPDEEEMRAILLAQLRTWLTEILMTVTKGEIERIADEVYKKKKKKAQTAQSSASLATMLNLGVYGTDEEDESKTETDNDTTTDFSDDDENDGYNSPSNGLTDEQKNVSPSAMDSMDSDPFKRPLLPPRVGKTTPAAGNTTTVTVNSALPMTTTTKEEAKKTFVNEKLSTSAASQSKSKSKSENGDKERKLSSRDKKHRSRSRSKETDKKSSSSFSDNRKEKRRCRWDDSASSNSNDSNNNNNRDSKSGSDKNKSDRSRKDDKDRRRSSPKKKSKSPSRDRKTDDHHSKSKRNDDERKKHRRSRSPQSKDKKSSRKRTRSRSKSPARHGDSKDKHKKSR